MSWWDPVDLAVGQELHLSLGQLEIRVARLDGLIRVGHRSVPDPEGTEVRFRGPEPAEDLPAEWHGQRYAVRPGRVSLVPRTAPLAVVARPDTPFDVAPGASAQVFVSTPLWVGVRSNGLDLVEFPVVPTKKTWFGSSTEGEACYAMRTVMRMSLADVVQRPHRAISPITVKNEGDDPLHIERLWLPVPNLTLHQDPSGQLWTREVHLTRHEGQETAERTLGKAGPGPSLARPRVEPSANVVMRVFNSVFG